ncbi:MAG TPA: hypothetical protein VEH29_15400 [Acidimicrobiales bacterium]|nr:hypothetical protein [Acidimicrobiales bacterium]
MTAEPEAPRRRATVVAGRGVVAALLAVSISLLGVTTASAAGDASLEPYILSNPVPGWTADPPAVSQKIDNELTSSLSSKIHEKTETALNAWEGPAASGILLIILIRFPGSSIPPSYSNSTSAVSGVCAGAGQSPGSVTSVAGIPGAASETCRSTTGSPLTVVAWPKGNVVGFVEAEGLGATEVDQVAVNEDNKLPANGIGESGSSSSSSLEGGIGAVVVAAIVIGIVLARRRSKAQVAPAAAGQWAQPGAAAPPWGYQGAQQGPLPAATPGYGAAGAYPAGGSGQPAGGSGYPAGGSGYPAGSGAYAAPAAAGPAAAGGYPAASGFEAAAPPPQASGPAPYQHPRPSDQARAGHYAGTQPAAGPAHAAAPAPVVGSDDATVIDNPPPVVAADRPAEPGWHPVDGDPYRQRYWDGTGWTSHLRWDGTAWVNDS